MSLSVLIGKSSSVSPSVTREMHGPFIYRLLTQTITSESHKQKTGNLGAFPFVFYLNVYPSPLSDLLTVCVDVL